MALEVQYKARRYLARTTDSSKPAINGQLTTLHLSPHAKTAVYSTLSKKHRAPIAPVTGTMAVITSRTVEL